MKTFNDTNHIQVKSEDGSFTAYSKEYDEHYHSTKDGALKESYKKHVIPAFGFSKNKKEIHILDICYGLGFNTLCSVLYYQKHAPDIKLYIYSPELDDELVKSLKNFTYPSEFDKLKDIIKDLSDNGVYQNENLYIEVYLGDARSYIKGFSNKFDIVYQDAFSPSVNPLLWTKEYFLDIKISMKDDGILTTYSTALKTRLALYLNGFYIYLNKGDDFRTATIASLLALEGLETVDMEHKISCNKDILPLSDK